MAQNHGAGVPLDQVFKCREARLDACEVPHAAFNERDVVVHAHDRPAPGELCAGQLAEGDDWAPSVPTVLLRRYTSRSIRVSDAGSG